MDSESVGRRRSALHRPFDPQFYQVHSLKGLQGVHRPAQAGLWRTQSQSGGGRI